MQVGTFYRACISIILVLLIIYLLWKVQFLFEPLVLAFNIVLMPILFSIFFYYLLRPIVGRMQKWKVPRAVSILLIYAVLAGLLVLFFFLVWPTLQKQTLDFINSLPQLANDVRKQINYLQNQEIFQGVNLNDSSMTNRMTDYLSDAVNYVSDYVSGAVSFITTFVIVVGTVPILLYYMLKQDRAGCRKLIRSLPRHWRYEARKTLLEIDRILSEFILGRVLLCFLLGAMIYAGFLLVGLRYSLLLAIFAAIVNLIPYIGQIIGMVPVVIVAFIDSPTTVIWVLLINLIAQNIESNLLGPHIYGRKLDIHPVTTILTILIAGTISGIVGIMIAIPVYMIAKVLVRKLYVYLVRNRERLPEGPDSSTPV
ncbi:AI-2E family transporter [Paenibacillus sp. 1P07SE]|uniref:AI-2E family transporter n=1 Tax=Paenibacillus sp. 1P07SE TaxID=3132209 RepID=UPI0039A6BBDC